MRTSRSISTTSRVPAEFLPAAGWPALAGKDTVNTNTQPQNKNRPVIAVTTGDPAGIGPEICARLFSRVKPARSAPLLIGAPGVFGPWLKRAGFKQDSGYRVLDNPGEAVRAAV